MLRALLGSTGFGSGARVVRILSEFLLSYQVFQLNNRDRGYLIKAWDDEDEIVIVGYGRGDTRLLLVVQVKNSTILPNTFTDFELGAHVATILADIISRLGIPQGNPSHSNRAARALYKKYRKGELNVLKQCNHACVQYNCKYHPFGTALLI